MTHGRDGIMDEEVGSRVCGLNGKESWTKKWDLGFGVLMDKVWIVEDVGSCERERERDRDLGWGEGDEEEEETTRLSPSRLPSKPDSAKF